MDYRELLKKYIRHVSKIEGVYFVFGYTRSELFTDAEWNRLKELVTEIADEDNLRVMMAGQTGANSWQ